MIKENLNKSNKLYISAANQRIKYLREENALQYKRNLKIENMTKRLQLLKEKQQQKDEENEERRRLEDKINKDKTIMMDRLQMIFQSDGDYSKEEINDFVFNGVKPKKNQKKEQNKNVENNAENNAENNEDNNGEKAFLTGLPQE